MSRTSASFQGRPWKKGVSGETDTESYTIWNMSYNSKAWHLTTDTFYLWPRRFSETPCPRRNLTKDDKALGKALIYGPPSLIVTALLKCALLNHLVIEKAFRLLKTEVGNLCSKKNHSSLRNCSKEDLVNFDFEKLWNEWKERAPLFYSFLLMACNRGQRHKATTWLPSMAIAGSILLKQRNPHMNAIASTMSLLLKPRSTEVSIYSNWLVCLLWIETSQLPC